MQPKRCGQENQPLKDTVSKGNQYEIHDKHKWTGQEVGVNSNVPLVDSGTGKTNVLRQFEFVFSPDFLRKLKQKKVLAPTKQDLFNSNWKQIEITLWGDGLIPFKEVEPRIIVGKKKYKIFILCEPRLGVMVAEKVRTLQEITPVHKNG